MTRWNNMREPNIDPVVESLVSELMRSADDLRTARIRLENLDVQALLDEVTEVTAEFMSNLAEAEYASAELKAFAARVRSGECEWSEIETKARPIPLEVSELKESPRFEWIWTSNMSDPSGSIPQATRAQEPDSYQLGPGEVGPSDWSDDFNDYGREGDWRW
ncbi:hypothetical protein GCM10011591_22970 [Nocardia camponoti]|uniref:Uncharacterized protein n=1 Tax=Nocardia camponoti TaxID=1616106 RepID=A0A917QHH4_9NOCA|nr:hypothetical protein GCM10011591_22970 [Nocardia camponoti]